MNVPNQNIVVSDEAFPMENNIGTIETEFQRPGGESVKRKENYDNYQAGYFGETTAFSNKGS